MSTTRPYSRAVFGLLLVATLVVVLTPRLAAQARRDRRASSPAATTLLPNYGERARVADFYMAEIGDVLVDPARGRLYVAGYTESYLDTGPTLQLIDIAQAQLIDSFEGSDLSKLALSADGSRLIAVTADPDEPDSFRVYDAASLALLDELPAPCPTGMASCWVANMAAGPGGRLYWAFHEDHRVQILDVATGTALSPLELPAGNQIVSLEIAGDKLFIAENDAEPRLRRFDISAVAPIPEHAAPIDYFLNTLRVAPDGSYLVTVDQWELK